MNLPKVFNRCLNQSYKILAITLVLFAVAISALRLMLPYVNNYRVNLQNYINDSYQLDLIIGDINAGWSKSGPSLVAQNVRLLQADQASVFIDRIDFRIDFWASIFAGKFITNDLTLSGTKIFIDNRLKSSSTSTKVITNTKKQKNKNNDNLMMVERITRLFLNQIERFSIKNSQVIIKTAANEKHTMVINQLAWQNTSQHHNAQGNVVFGNLSAKNLKLQLSLEGNNLHDLTGQIYLEGNNLDITPWLEQALKIDNDKITSSINFKSWLTLEKGSAKKLQISLGKNHIYWSYQNKKHQLGLLQGQIEASFSNGLKQFALSSSPLQFTLDQNKWQAIILQAEQVNGILNGYLSDISLQNIIPLVPLLSDDNHILKQLTALSPQGNVHNIYLQKYQQKYNVIAEFNNISVSYSNGIPGIEHLSGDLIASGNKFQLSIKAKRGKLDFDKHFMRAFPYQYIAAVINGSFDRSGWKIGSDNLIFNSKELELTGALGVRIPKEGTPIFSLFAQVKDIEAINAKYYFPHLLMGEHLVNYLDKGIKAGDISQATVLFNGPLSKFPFTDHSGVFTVNADLNESIFQFDPAWPAITHFRANLNFTNNSMLITGRSGNLLGVDVQGVKASIADLSGDPVLNIDAGIVNANANAVKRVMQHSPLQNTVGRTLEQLVLSGKVNGQFNLNIPLKHPDKTVASGVINLRNNKLTLKAPMMFFDNVNGQLFFKNDRLTTKNLTLHWLNMPLNLVVNAKNNSNYYQTDINISANWPQKTWQQQVPKLLHSYAKGVLKWQANLDLFMPQNGDFSYKLRLKSSLKSMRFSLPSPYRKTNNSSLHLIAKANGDVNQSTIDIKIGDKLSFYGALSHKKAKFLRANLVLGNEQMLLPMHGFHITTNLEKVNFSQWQPVISDIIHSVEQSALNDPKVGVPILASPERIEGSIDQFNFYGQKLSKVSFDLFNKPQWWLLQLNAKEARAQLKIYPNWSKQGLEVNADFLHLPEVVEAKSLPTNSIIAITDKPQNKRSHQTKIFTDIPPMKVHCDSCRYGKLDLGKVDFTLTRKQPDVLTINNFVAQRGKNKLTFSGRWSHDKTHSSTQVDGRVHTPDIAHEFKKLGYASTIKESGATVNFDLNWQGGPQSFNLAHLNGHLKAKIDDGYLAQVNDEARIFSILSLGSLVRKLSLDFRDIFSDGMFYSKITGDFDIKNGIIYTNNTKMKGAAGDLVMKGNTRLVDKKLDYRVSYKPNLTSSLPVLAWIATLNPVTFLAGVALDKVLTSTVVSEFKFEVTGTAMKPVWREVTRKTKNVMVGRATAPQFVDNLDKIKFDKSKSKKNRKTVIKPATNNKQSTKNMKEKQEEMNG